MKKLNLNEISTDAEICMSNCLRNRLDMLRGQSIYYIRDRVKELRELSRLTTFLERVFEEDLTDWCCETGYKI